MHPLIVGAWLAVLAGQDAALVDALLLMNSPLVVNGPAPGRIFGTERGDAERVRAVFLRVLSRPPSPAEESRWVPRAATSKGLEDLFWTLLNTSEFLFKH